MAIKEVITLEGVEQVEAALARINVAGENSLKQFRELGTQGTGQGFDKLVEGAKKAGLELDNTSESAVKMSTVFKTLKPICNPPVLRWRNLGSLARLASTSLAAFGAATGGASKLEGVEMVVNTDAQNILCH